ncbi:MULTISPECIES: cupin-like domain-containing protein [unclassified Sphingopyxis]|uniref:cupin-like domain-containing protein n=1 Tax=unclassified Sphingopyxis TaxID=2614943 RepID=UPI0007307490|nr:MULTISPECIES: cupin-like domain-containing protein [unclassified Sphingopyxis]KTE24671.1 cupin [Sphingopyxis sp. H057]KTE49631.1 cupin [Sphingopyxis sp. H071]KTE50694.1 cupin [Sphingopyxis sp. H073]KTE57135.1 cupin [Sphingopyxis sp. H107]KTE62137.1 cupin [Sphingopyxis sp. H100]
MADRDGPIYDRLARVPEREWSGAGLDSLLDDAREPFVLRGLVADWPLVAAAKRSARDVRRYLLDHARDRPFMVSIGPPGHDGRLFYDHDMAMNFRAGTGKLADIFGGIDKGEQLGDIRTVYLASIDIPTHFDGLDEANPLDLGARDPLKSIWIGTRTRIAAHNDFPDNLACCAAGRRRFTLFPPDQFRNLYLGPIDHTPAGRVVSMVDFDAPDLAAHPRFVLAMAHALTVELEPGDAIFIPSMWWHHVEGLADFNILVNYWWRRIPAWLGQPQEALNHAILAIRDLPPEDKAIWRDLFDHYVFENDGGVTDHIPESARSILAPLTPETAGRLRAFLLRTLSR